MGCSRVVTFVSLIWLVLPACSGDSERAVMTTRELEAFVRQRLEPGDSAADVEAFLDDQGWPYSYDDYQRRYSVEYPEGVKRLDGIRWKTAMIWIYCTEEEGLTRMEVGDVYTGV